MKTLFSIAILAFLLAGCATTSAPTAPVPVNPFTTPEIEGERTRCLASGKVWLEVQDKYACLSPDAFQRERERT